MPGALVMQSLWRPQLSAAAVCVLLCTILAGNPTTSRRCLPLTLQDNKAKEAARLKALAKAEAAAAAGAMGSSVAAATAAAAAAGAGGAAGAGRGGRGPSSKDSGSIGCVAARSSVLLQIHG